jgi:Type VI secretion system/phage-baseplate injector OB domain
MNVATEINENLKENGLEGIGRYYSFYDALVQEVFINDFSLKVTIPELASNTITCKPFGFYAGPNYGIYALPQKGDNVRVVFQNGDINYPFWVYGAIAKKDIPQETQNSSVVIMSPNSKNVFVGAKNGKITIKANDNTIELLDNNKIVIKNGNQNLKSILDSFIDVVKGMQVILPSGIGTLSPAQILQLSQIKVQLDTLLA